MTHRRFCYDSTSGFWAVNSAVECHPHTMEVAGSNPAQPTTLILTPMKDMIKSLLSIQDRDLEMDRLRSELSSIPKKIAKLKTDIQSNKTALEDAKKEVIQLQMLKKQKELDLEGQEASIRKHSTELNAVKTNEAYRALLGEIDKAKQETSGLEDQILQIMEQIDQAGRVWKEKESGSKAQESGLLKEITDLEARQQELQQALAAKESEREQALSSLSKSLADQYNKLRNGKRGAALVPILKEQCSGCHMKVSQNLINEVRRGQKLVTCESCSRIVYLEEVLAA
jgi:predicted  nucleic acid-binding Zn-ribbon protein